MEEIAGGAQLRGDADGRPDLRHLRGVPDRQEDAADRRRDHRAGVRARRAAHGDRDRAQRPRVLHPRREPDQGRARPRRCSRSSPPKSASTSARSRSATASSSPATRSSSRGRRSCSSRARRAACSPKAPKQLREGVERSAGAAHRHQVRARLAQVLQALRRAVRGLRRQADLPRVRRRRARAPRPADPRVPRAASSARRRAPAPRRAGRRCQVARRSPRRVIDLHTHTTASDGRCTPAELVARAAAAGVTVLERHRPRHRRRLRRGRGGVPRPPASSSSPASRSPRSATSADVHVLGYFIDPRVAGAAHVSRRAARSSGSIACAR